MVIINSLIPEENVVIDNEKNKIIINTPKNIFLNVISSALFAFSDDNFILFDKDIIHNGFIINIVPKGKLDKTQLQELGDSIISQINVYNIHKQKLEKNKELVNFIMDLIIKTNSPEQND